MSNGRRYIATLESILVSATSDLFEVVSDSTTFIEILEFHISQETLVGDAFAEANTIDFITEHTTAGDNSAGIEISPLASGDNLFIGAVHKNLLTLASGGSPTTVYSNTWHNRIPWSVIFTPETNRIISPGKRMVIRLGDITTPIRLSAVLIFQEFGGTKRIFSTVGLTSEIDTVSQFLYVRLAISNERGLPNLSEEAKLFIGFEQDNAFSVVPVQA